MERNFRKERTGITLIALIITIVVLLILAGITISYVVGENGIFQQARNAKNEIENAQQRDKDDIDVDKQEQLIMSDVEEMLDIIEKIGIAR